MLNDFFHSHSPHVVANYIFCKISIKISNFLAHDYQDMPSCLSFPLHHLYPYCSENGLLDGIADRQIQIDVSLPVLLSLAFDLECLVSSNKL